MSTRKTKADDNSAVTADTAPKNSKQFFGLVFGITISFGILGYFLSQLDWQAFFIELKRVNLWMLPVFALAFCSTYWLRAWRWRYLLPRSEELSYRNLYDSFSLGALGMFILPFRAGEIIRAYTLKRWQSMPFSVAFASIITERAFDVLTLLILFGLCLSQVDNAPAEIVSAAYLLGIFAGVILTVMILCYFFSEQMLAIFRWKLGFILRGRLPGVQEKLVEFASGIIEGFRAIRGSKDLAIVFTSSLALWILFGAISQIGLWCFGEYPSFWVGLTVNVVIALAIAIPSAPGFLGVYQLGCWLALSGIFGYSKEFAFAYAILTHSLQFILVLSLGFWTLQRRGLKLTELQKS